MDTFQSLEIHHHPKVWYSKNFSRMRTLRKKKICQETKTKRYGRGKKRERRRDVAAKNLNKELKRIKKAEKAVVTAFRLLYPKILQAQAQTLTANKNKKLA